MATAESVTPLLNRLTAVTLAVRLGAMAERGSSLVQQLTAVTRGGDPGPAVRRMTTVVLV